MPIATTSKEILRRWTPPELRVIGGWLLPSTRAELHAVRTNLTIPTSLSHRRRVHKGAVWAVTMVHDEEQTITHVLEHLLKQGVDQIIVADNNSADATPDLLADFARCHPVHVVQDRLVAHFQGRKMTILAGLARRSGAEWIVPFDADELWFARGTTVADFLRHSHADVVTAEIHNVFPSTSDDQDELNVFARLTSMADQPHAMGKVAFRSHPLAKLPTGQHQVTRRGAREPGLYIAHFPWRTFDQLVHKVTHGRMATELTGDRGETGAHWRRAGAMGRDELQELWREMQAGRAVPALAWSPDGPLTSHRVSGWTSWEA